MIDIKKHNRLLHHLAVKRDEGRVYGKLIEKHKWLFRKPGRYTPFHLFGFECDEGWHGIIEELVEGIERVADKEEDNWIRKHIRVFQVKEKFGTLRFYLAAYTTDELVKLIRKAEERSATICEACGKPGKLRKVLGGYLKTLCEDCYKIRKTR